MASASSLFNFLRTLAGSIGTSLTTFIWYNREAVHHTQLTEVINPYNGEILSEIRSTADGIIFYAEDQPTILENASAFQVIKKLHE